jgi:hypothetical protein
MSKDKGNSTGTIIWLSLAIFILSVVVAVFLYRLLTGTEEMKTKDIFLWFLFMLLAAAISCIFNAIVSNSLQKSEEIKETNMIKKVEGIFTEKSDEIKDIIKIAFEESDLICGDQDSILKILMERCLKTGQKIKKIKILAYTSDSFSGFFTTHFKNRLFDNKPFECRELNILIHNQQIDKNSDVVKKWVSLYKDKEIDTLEIRKANIYLGSFFGMIIELEMTHHLIGLIGFYEPRITGEPIPFNKRYGVFSEGDSILDVLDEYFNYYFHSATPLKEEIEDQD